MEELVQKGVAHTTRMEMLGIIVDTVPLTLEVTPDRITEISLLVEALLCRKKAYLRDLQSLLGKLHCVFNYVLPGRLFVSRLLNSLRQALPSNIVGSRQTIFMRMIPTDVKIDLLWWHTFLHGYNGVSIMSLENWSYPDDACLDGFGDISLNQFFHALFPSFIKENQLHIDCLELLAIVIATKIWGHMFKWKTY